MSENNELTKEITAIIQGVFTAFENGEVGGIESYMHPDATVWDVFTPHLIRGVEEREQFHADDKEQMQARGTLTLTVENPDVDCWDETAIALYYIHYKYEPPNATEGRVRITDVFRKIDKKWKIVHHHEGAVPTGIPPINN